MNVIVSASGHRSADALHPPLHQRQPEPQGGGEDAEAQSEDRPHPGAAAAEDLQGLRPGAARLHRSSSLHRDGSFTLLW